MDDSLAEAYIRFDMWCKTNSRCTSIDEFSKQGFGMGKHLGIYIWIFFTVSDPQMYYNSIQLSSALRCATFTPRKGNTFPTTLGGKAYDTGLVMSWLEVEVNAPKAISVAKNVWKLFEDLGGIFL